MFIFRKIFQFVLRNQYIIFPYGSIRRRIALFLFNKLLKFFVFRSKIKKNYKIKGNQDYKQIEFKYEKKPLVSIIMPVYNQFEFTYQCLHSILENTKNVSYEIILSDDCSNDETINAKQYFKNIIILRNEKNQGFINTCNKAAKVANGEYLLLLNNDTVVLANWLLKMLEIFYEDSKVGIVGSKLIYPNGLLQEAGGIVWKDGSAANFGKFNSPQGSEYNYKKEVDYISGACLMIKKSIWVQINGFDTRYCPAYYEDTDLAFEVRKAGYKIVYQPHSEIVHFEGMSNGLDLSKGIKAYQVLNKEKFYNKWKNILSSEHNEPNQDLYYAKDRSKNKKTILIFDTNFLQFDKNAGAKSIFHYMKLYVKMGYNVKFFSEDRLLIEPYASVLQDIGIELISSNIKKWVKQNRKYIDFIIFQRIETIQKYFMFIKRMISAKIIFFPHDLYHLRIKRQGELFKKRKLIRISEKIKKMEFKYINLSDYTYVFGEYEYKYLKTEFPNKNIRNIPLFFYQEKGRRIDPIERKDLMFLGNFKHIPNIDGIMWFLKEVFPDLILKIPDIKLYIIGDNPTDEIRKESTKYSNIILTGFVNDNELNEYLQKIKIMIIPLRFGAGVKGKLLDGLFYGMPIVSTSIGIEGMPGIEKIVLKADNKNEFIEQIMLINSNAELYSNISQKSISYIYENFSENNIIKVMNEDLK